jgi:hypothetical protein
VGTVLFCPSSTSLPRECSVKSLCADNDVFEEFRVKDTAYVPSLVVGPVARS